MRGPGGTASLDAMSRTWKVPFSPPLAECRMAFALGTATTAAASLTRPSSTCRAQPCCHSRQLPSRATSTAPGHTARSDAAVIVARDTDGKVAVLMSDFPRHGGRCVFLPGGRREGGENPEECARAWSPPPGDLSALTPSHSAPPPASTSSWPKDSPTAHRPHAERSGLQTDVVARGRRRPKCCRGAALPPTRWAAGAPPGPARHVTVASATSLLRPEATAVRRVRDRCPSEPPRFAAEGVRPASSHSARAGTPPTTSTPSQGTGTTPTRPPVRLPHGSGGRGVPGVGASRSRRGRRPGRAPGWSGPVGREAAAGRVSLPARGRASPRHGRVPRRPRRRKGRQ